MQLYVNKEEVFYASMVSKVEQANKDGRHSAARKVINRITGMNYRNVCSRISGEAEPLDLVGLFIAASNL